MSIALPSSPLPATATPRPLDFGAWQSPPGGGDAQRIERSGSRFALDITTPHLRPEPDSRIWVSRLLQGISDTVVFPFPQPGLTIGNPGFPVVDGGSQAGQTLLMRGFIPGYTMREGQVHSIIIAGQRYLYVALADRVADGAGKLALPIWPPIRVSPANGATCEVAAPMIEGALTGQEKGWTLARAQTRGLTFTITEIE